MKKILYIIPFLLCFGNTFAQNTPEFSFKLYFEDAVGNKDTVTLGYDSMATDSIDTDFGEVNIINQAWDTDFEVRVTNSFFYSSGGFPNYDSLPLLNMKKQVVENSFCAGSNGTEPFPIEIDIKCTNYPITVSWDSTLFQSFCNAGSFITSHAFGMWNEGGYEELRFSAKKSVVFGLAPSYDFFQLGSSIYTIDNIPIRNIWLQFQDSTYYTLSTNHESLKRINIYPNPFRNKFFIGQLGSQKIQNITITNLLGNKQKFIRIENQIIMPDAESGMYLIRIKFENSKNRIIKMIKK